MAGAVKIHAPDPRPAQTDPEIGHATLSPGETSPNSPNLKKRTNSWDFMAGLKKLESSYEGFDSRHASQAHLVFADGDVPKNKLSKLYNYLLSVSIVTRWILFIAPVLAILWIPGILHFTKFPNAQVWGVQLHWWSIWLSVVWGGWWAALAGSRLLPVVMKATIGVVAVASRRYIEWASALHRYIALFAWSLAIWISWNPIIDIHQSADASDKSQKVVKLLGRLLFGILVCILILLFEKFAIQWIAGKFHERSYAERIADQKLAVKVLVTLYRNSSDIPDRTDTLLDGNNKRNTMNPAKILKAIRHGVRVAATTTTTALGNVASEIAGSSVLQPNSPQAIVKTALESANKSRLLARRLFYSFAKQGAHYLLVEDIQPYFSDKDEADTAFALFDKDSNGDATREEIEIACLEFHREQLSIENSMRDLDSAVGRLDNIFMTLYVVIVALVIAVVLEAQLVALITGAGTLILGLSWLIGGSLQEVLTSIIFLFVKHPFDVGDRVAISKEVYTVKEIRLLTTIFLDSGGTCVSAPNLVLNGQMSEKFTFDVNYSTSFEDIEKLRQKMLEFVQAERRDYQPVFDVSVVDFPNQEKMILSADIKYKSNSQMAALKSKRRNKWVCALKLALAELHIHGTGGSPAAPPNIARYTEVPWSTVQAQDRHAEHAQPDTAPAGGWQLTDSKMVLRKSLSMVCNTRPHHPITLTDDDSRDVFGEADQVSVGQSFSETRFR
ncbi:hypothetical protein BDN72DRAFT_757999 [Pluteus cervinus]|uniref:Uncharacterized protein n=1 Tax=Pluteus cervinus TaxID=181527 RepID=A0ACD3BCV9_9AGAR|nr:hypothetical protein BDN72DRAFT_757999 [Pluteus cervinus]